MSDPKKFGKYVVVRTLGAGAMGVVYECFDPQIQRRVAIKAIHEELLQKEKSAPANPHSGVSRKELDTLRSRFRREAQAAGRLNHARIVTVYDVGEETLTGQGGKPVSTPYIVMEFVEGTELKKPLDNGERFTLRQIVKIMDELLEALGYSHANNVVHRDIKPANIMVLADSIKIADFGIARLGASTLTETGAVFGTPSYMAPEQVHGTKVDGRADLYAAGVVLYELLTGDRPFTGNFTAVLAKVLHENPLPPSEMSVSVPKAFDAVVARALAKRPEDRFQTAEEFRQALHKAYSPPAAARTTNGALLIGVGAGVLVLLLASTFIMLRKSPIETLQPPVATERSGAPAPVLPLPSRGTITVTALGLVPATAGDATQQGLAEQVKTDARQRLLAKAAALYFDPNSLAAHYELLRNTLFPHSELIQNVLSNAAPQRAPGGLMWAPMSAKLDAHALHKLLNEAAENEHVDLTRNPASLRVSLQIKTQDSDAGAPSAQRSEAAENILKERLNSYGFILVGDPARADFKVDGVASIKRLTLKLEASGITIEKFVLTSWTLKATHGGDEIYFKTETPQKQQSWATRELALKAVGQLVAEQLSQGLFLKNFDDPPQRTLVLVDGLRPQSVPALLPWLQSSWLVLDAVDMGVRNGSPVLQVDLSGGARDLSQVVEQALVDPLNAQLQRPCLSILETTPASTRLKFDPACESALRNGPQDSWHTPSRQVRSPGAPATAQHVGTLAMPPPRRLG